MAVETVGVNFRCSMGSCVFMLVLLMGLSPRPGFAEQEADLGEQIEAVAGSHIRLVWAGLAKPGISDPESVSQQQQLFGLDSRDGRGVRKISLLDGNFSRPLLTPLGERVVYSRWDPEKQRSHIHVTQFAGGLHSPLAPGYAVDVLKTADSPKTWIYALRSLRRSENDTWVAGRLVRFAIDQPQKVDVVYEGEPVVVGSVSLAPTGETMQAVRPERGLGLFDIDSGSWTAQQSAPVGVEVFDMPFGLSLSPSKLASAVSAGGEARDIRSSDDRSLVVFSARLESAQAGSEEIYLVSLSGKGQTVKKAVTIAGPQHADHMPDLWLGEMTSRPASRRQEEVVRQAGKWPAVEERGALFWEDNSEGAMRTMEFRMMGKGRFGRDFVMTPEGGAVVPLAGSQRKIEAIIDTGGSFSIELLLQGHANPGGQVLFYCAGFALVEQGGQLYAMVKDWGNGLWTIADYCECDAQKRPRSVVYTRDGEDENWFIDGEWSSVKRAPRPASLRIDTKGLTTYFSGCMELSLIGFYPRALKVDEIRQVARVVRQKTSNWKLADYREVEATLLEAAEFPQQSASGDSGRLLVDHRYRIEAVGKGNAGLSVGDEVSVAHWVMLGSTILDGFPRTPGRRCFLALEPAGQHPELQLETKVGDFSDQGMPAFVAVDRRLNVLSAERLAAVSIDAGGSEDSAESPSVKRPKREPSARGPGLPDAPLSVTAGLPAVESELLEPTSALADALPDATASPSLPPLLSAGTAPSPAKAAPQYPRLVPTYPAPPPVSDETSAAPAPAVFSVSEVRSTLQQASELIRQRQTSSQLEEAARMRAELLRDWEAGR